MIIARRLPRRTWLKIISLACLVISLPLVYLLVQDNSRGQPLRQVNSAIGFFRENSAAPQFTLPLLQRHGDIQLQKLSGLPIVLNFWASYCSICKEESPAIATVSHETHGAVQFLGIDTLDERANALSFLQRFHINYPMAVDASGSVAAQYRVPGLPVTVFIARNGKRILGVNIGQLTAKSLMAILRQLYGVV